MAPAKILKKAFAPYAVLVFGLLLSAAGCATNRYQGPTSARSADFQIATSQAIEKALNKVSFSGYEGKKVWIEVFTLTQRVGNESPEEGFIKNWAGEMLRRNNAAVALSEAGSDLRLDIRAKAVGVTKTRRDFIPVYYSERTSGVAELHLTAYDSKTGGILFTQDVSGKTGYTQVYWVYMFGPIVYVE